MRGYPKYVATKKDYDNLLGLQEHSKRAQAELSDLFKLDDGIVNVDEGTLDKPSSKQISNPFPKWKQLGYKSRAAVSAMSEVLK